MFDFGPLSAEADNDLINYFYTTKQFDKVIQDRDSTTFSLVSKPGGGKTSIVKKLLEDFNSQIVIPILSKQTRILVEDDSTSTAEDYRLLMSYEIYTGILHFLLENEFLEDPLANELKTYKKNVFTELKEFFSKTFESGELQAFGFGASLAINNRKNFLNKIRKKNELDILEDYLQQIASHYPILVVIDNPEAIVGEGLEDVSKENAIKIGVFLKVLSQLHSLKIKVIVFVKEHIFQIVKRYYRDFSHFENGISTLQWTEDDLLELIRRRVKNRLKSSWNKVFSISERKFCEIVFPNLINGPRDLILLCNNAGQTNSEIAKSDLQKSIANLRIRKWEDIQTQYSEQWPLIDTFSKILINGLAHIYNNTPFTKANFQEVFDELFKIDNTLGKLRNEEAWIRNVKWDNPLEILYFVGCVGFIQNNKKILPWCGKPLEEFRKADLFFIIDLFALN